MTSQKKKDPLKQLPEHPCRNPLPPIARSILKKAASIEPEAPLGTSRARTEALDEAIREVKRLFHQYFRN